MKTARIALVVFVALILVAFTFALAPTAVQAAEPNFFRLVVPHAPGSAADGHARLLSDRLAKVLGKPVVVENIPGAGGIKGIHEIVRAPKDGYTIGLTTSNIVITPSLYEKMPYDLLKDVTPISIIANRFICACRQSGSTCTQPQRTALTCQIAARQAELRVTGKWHRAAFSRRTFLH